MEKISNRLISIKAGFTIYGMISALAWWTTFNVCIWLAMRGVKLFRKQKLGIFLIFLNSIVIPGIYLIVFFASGAIGVELGYDR
jgi:hypothetical protein